MICTCGISIVVVRLQNFYTWFCPCTITPNNPHSHNFKPPITHFGIFRILYAANTQSKTLMHASTAVNYQQFPLLFRAKVLHWRNLFYQSSKCLNNSSDGCFTVLLMLCVVIGYCSHSTHTQAIAYAGD